VIEAFGYGLLGMLLLLLGGDSMLRGGSGLGQRLGLAPHAAGLLQVSLIGSVPLLVVEAYAWHSGATELALGSAVGANVVLLGLVLGVSALARPLQVTRRGMAAELVFVLVASGGVMFAGTDGVISGTEGGVLLAAFILVLAYAWRVGGRDGDAVRAELAALAHTGTGWGQNIARVVVAGVVLWFGARFLVDGAFALGQGWGLSPTKTGVLLVAIGATVPAAAVVALAARGASGNIAVGHALAACLANLLLAIGAMALLRPLSVPPELVSFDLPAAMALALVFTPALGGDLKLARREGGLLLALFLGWLALECLKA
jgi:cation:H+ antiporter